MVADRQSLGQDVVQESRDSLSSSGTEQYRTIMELLEFFADQPTFYEFSQYMVMQMFAQFNPWGACVAVASHHDRMMVLGSFGLGEGLLRQYSSSSCIGMPLDKDIHINGNPQAGTEPGASLVGKCSLSDTLISQGPNALGIVSSHMTFVGFFQVLFLQPADSPELVSKLEATLSVLRVVVPSRVQTHTSHLELHEQLAINSRLDTHEQNGEWSPDGIVLTSRQGEILRYMADGKTNAAIARIIGFSESTVRQETIDIYRKLGVNDRRNAVLSAQMVGLLPQTTAIFS